MEIFDCKNERYHVIFEKHEHYIEFFAYEINDLMQDFPYEYDEMSANEFYNKTLKEDVKPQVTFSIKWDGCVNMNPINDGVLMHFCSQKGINDFSQFMNDCYSYAKSIFDFDE
jgi:hypothetical protein